MIASATTTVTLYRGQTEDEWGDPIDANNVVATGVPASIVEINQNAETEVSLTPRVIRQAIGRVGSEVDIQPNDRIYDERYEETWIIRSVIRVRNPVCDMGIKLSLQRVD